MERFLTMKAQKGAWWEYVVMHRNGENGVPFARMDDISGVRQAAWKLNNLLDKGCMRGVVIDTGRKVVRLSGDAQ